MKNFFLIGFCLVSLMFNLTINAGEMHGLRDQRYCEILLGNRFSKNIHVYNTIGLNQCPADVWNKITPEIIKQETGATFVHLNGPRYWTIDGLQNSNLINTSIQVLGDLAMREAGVLELNLQDIINSKTPYKKHSVQRKTTWIYESGKPIYEIINSQGEVFIMQSYSVQKVFQDGTTLTTLGSKLHLPEGWNFRVRVLDKNIYLTAKNNLAVVIQDEYLNTYQQQM